MNWGEHLEMLANTIPGELDEALKKKFVVRNGKRVAKWKSTRAGKYRVEYDENGKPKEVRITAQERINRRKGQKKGKIKRNAKIANIEKKRKRSFIARRNVGLKNYNLTVPDVVVRRPKYVPVNPNNKDL
jgi:hypothetical protein